MNRLNVVVNRVKAFIQFIFSKKSYKIMPIATPIYLPDELNAILSLAFFSFLFLVVSALLFNGFGVILVSILIILISSMLTLYVVSLPMGDSNSLPKKSVSFLDRRVLLAFPSIVFCVAYIGVGCHYTIAFLKVGNIINFWLWIWLASLFVIPSTIFVIFTYKLNYSYNWFIKTEIIIGTPKALPMLIDKLHVLNDVYIAPYEIPLHPGANGLDRGEFLAFDNYQFFHSGYRFLRKNGSEINLSWWSIAENRYFNDNFKIIWEKFDIRREVHSFDGHGFFLNNKHGQVPGQKYTDPLVLFVYPTGIVNIFQAKGTTLTHKINYFNFESSRINDSTRDMVMQDYINCAEETMTSADLMNNVKFAENKNIAHTLLRSLKIYDWKLNISDTSKILTITVLDGMFNKFLYPKNSVAYQLKLPPPREILFRVKRKDNTTDSYLILVKLDLNEVLDIFADLTEGHDALISIKVELSHSESNPLTLFAFTSGNSGYKLATDISIID